MKKRVCILVMSFVLLASCMGIAACGSTSKESVTEAIVAEIAGTSVEAEFTTLGFKPKKAEVDMELTIEYDGSEYILVSYSYFADDIDETIDFVDEELLIYDSEGNVISISDVSEGDTATVALGESTDDEGIVIESITIH